MLAMDQCATNPIHSFDTEEVSNLVIALATCLGCGQKIQYLVVYHQEPKLQIPALMHHPRPCSRDIDSDLKLLTQKGFL